LDIGDKWDKLEQRLAELSEVEIDRLWKKLVCKEAIDHE
jgi:hypothetical protein